MYWKTALRPYSKAAAEPELPGQLGRCVRRQLVAVVSLVRTDLLVARGEVDVGPDLDLGEPARPAAAIERVSLERHTPVRLAVGDVVGACGRQRLVRVDGVASLMLWQAERNRLEQRHR